MAERITSLLGVEATLSHGMPVVQFAPAQVLDAARELRDVHGYDMLLDVTAVDWMGQAPRFEVVWHFFRSTDCTRVRIKTRVEEAAPVVDSLTPLYGSAAFMERECHEMLGIAFRGNADLRPILLYEGFVGHPLRKDYDKHHEQPLVQYRDAEGQG
ncbi:MAG: NADH-quinone oxidoreductase subunit C [Aquincola sp.]|nr:NADH-quinone oxidoreductase subunit C [Aquincola sp.]MDH4287978.1 NADH-quinone oxidoreductase subunit C [Aquincola sp.]MDH5329537.1 NADH-quinone oxidoreductase subunit C [Aquincola sp.]